MNFQPEFSHQIVSGWLVVRFLLVKTSLWDIFRHRRKVSRRLTGILDVWNILFWWMFLSQEIDDRNLKFSFLPDIVYTFPRQSVKSVEFHFLVFTLRSRFFIEKLYWLLTNFYYSSSWTLSRRDNDSLTYNWHVTLDRDFLECRYSGKSSSLVHSLFIFWYQVEYLILNIHHDMGVESECTRCRWISEKNSIEHLEEVSY